MGVRTVSSSGPYVNPRAAAGRRIEGKTFNDKNDFETSSHYGKKVFAHRVERGQQAPSISMAFAPQLTTLTSIITSHAAARK